MADAPDADPPQPTGAALLAQLQTELAKDLRKVPPIFRVVELARTPSGRLVRQGQIWHSDLSQVRRFGRALAANSVSQQVLIADSTGAVIEEIPVAMDSAGPAGWSGWRDLPLPPAPPRQKQKQKRLPGSPAVKTRPKPQPAPVPPQELPVVATELSVDAGTGVAIMLP